MPNFYKNQKINQSFGLLKNEDKCPPGKVVRKNGMIREDDVRPIERKFGYIYYKNGEVYRGMLNREQEHGLGERVSSDGNLIKRGKFGMMSC